MPEKVASSGGALAVYKTSGKVKIGEPNECGICNFGILQAYVRCVLKISKDYFKSGKMRFLRISLKTGTKAHTKHNVGPRCGGKAKILS
jgi:hypothetical protein